MEVYVMRHGQTVWNAKGIVQGWSKNRLSETGKQQAKEASQKFANVKFDLIISSPLMRTMQTANIMNQPHKVKIIKDNRLIEKKKGIFVGRLKSTLNEEENRLRYENPKAVGEETYQEIYTRCQSFACDLKKNFKDKTVLIVTHSCIASCLHLILNELDISEFLNGEENQFANAEVKKIEIK